MKTEQILQLVEAVSGYGLDEFEYEEDGVKLKLKKGTVIQKEHSMRNSETADARFGDVAMEKSVQAQKEDESRGVSPQGKIVKAPLVGIFYTSPEEGGEPFVKVGDKVEKGTVLAIVEAMKLMNEIESEFEGEILEILVENGQAVEYNQPLFVLG